MKCNFVTKEPWTTRIQRRQGADRISSVSSAESKS